MCVFILTFYSKKYLDDVIKIDVLSLNFFILFVIIIEIVYNLIE